MASNDSRRARAEGAAPGVPGAALGGTGAPLVDEQGEPLRFEVALAELEALVERMEAGDLSLEASLASYERGMRLYRYCQQTLEAAEQKVRILAAAPERPGRSLPPGADGLEPFEPPAGDQ